MYLVLQAPPEVGAPMTSLLYLRVKALVSILETSKRWSFQLVQSRILLAYYELGHGLLVDASRTIGACAKAARHLKLYDSLAGDNDIMKEEKRRTWWTLHNLDR